MSCALGVITARAGITISDWELFAILVIANLMPITLD